MKRIGIALLSVVVLLSGLGMAVPQEADACINGVRRHQKQRQRLVSQVRRMVADGEYRSAVSMALQVTGDRYRKPKDGEDRVATEMLALAIVRMDPKERETMGAIKRHFRTPRNALKWATQKLVWKAKRSKAPQDQALAAEAQLVAGKQVPKAVSTLEELHGKGLITYAATYRTMALHFGEGTENYTLYQNECVKLAAKGSAVCGAGLKEIEKKPELPKEKLRNIVVPTAKPRGKTRVLPKRKKMLKKFRKVGTHPQGA